MGHEPRAPHGFARGVLQTVGVFGKAVGVQEMVMEKRNEALPAELLHQGGQHLVGAGIVAEERAGFVVRLHREERAGPRGVLGALVAGRAETALHLQHVPDRRRLQAGVDGPLHVLGEVADDRGVQREPAVMGKHEHGHGGEALRAGIHALHAVFPEWLPVRLADQDAATGDQEAVHVQPFLPVVFDEPGDRLGGHHVAFSFRSGSIRCMRSLSSTCQASGSR